MTPQATTNDSKYSALVVECWPTARTGMSVDRCFKDRKTVHPAVPPVRIMLPKLAVVEIWVHVYLECICFPCACIWMRIGDDVLANQRDLECHAKDGVIVAGWMAHADGHICVIVLREGDYRSTLNTPVVNMCKLQIGCLLISAVQRVAQYMAGCCEDAICGDKKTCAYE